METVIEQSQLSSSIYLTADSELKKKLFRTNSHGPKGTSRAHLTGELSLCKRKLPCLSGDNFSSDELEGEESFSSSQYSENFNDDILDCLSDKLTRMNENKEKLPISISSLLEEDPYPDLVSTKSENVQITEEQMSEGDGVKSPPYHLYSDDNSKREFLHKFDLALQQEL